MSDVYKSGVIPAGGFAVENIANQKLPASITITDVAGTRAFQLSWDGVNYAAAVTPTVTDAAFISYALVNPARLVKITGTVGAAYEIRSNGG